MSERRRADRPFLILVSVLVVFGFLIFISASLGLVARDGAELSVVATKQFILGVVLGGIMLLAMAKIDYRKWRPYALYFFIAALFVTAAVFLPHIGATHGGARRWIDLGLISFQPAELLKLGVVMYLAAIFSSLKKDMGVFTRGPLILLSVLGFSGFVLAKQPDFGTLLVITLAAVGMFIAAKGKWKHILAIFLILVAAAGLVIMVKPYVKARVMTFLHPTANPLGSGYQVNQSLIAIGSGEITGRGFGRSIQKFQYLPEPTGDSIFAVASEEFGFIGSLTLILLFVGLAFRGFVIARRAPLQFGGLLVLGIVILVVSQSFINIASMLGVLPLTGMPLVFVSQGGTALLFGLLEMGIILNVSKYIHKA